MRVMLLLLVVCTCSAHGAEPSKAVTFRKSVDRGIEWLLSRQDEDGSIDSHRNKDKPGSMITKSGVPYAQNAVSALVLLSFHDAGHRVSDKSQEGIAMQKVLTFLCSGLEPQPVKCLSGAYLGKEDNSMMYGAAIIPYAMACAEPGLPKGELKKLCRRHIRSAVDFSVSSQQLPTKRKEHLGGWRYLGMSLDSDISITVWHLLLLRTAGDQLEIDIPQKTWNLATHYLKSLSVATDKGSEKAFLYQASDNRLTFSRTGAGILALQACGEGSCAEATEALPFLNRVVIDPNDRWLAYGLRHCSKAMKAAAPDIQNHFQIRLQNLLVNQQSANGSWSGNHASQGKAQAFSDEAITALSISALAPWAAPKK